jgi:hypothetical protein
VKTSCHRVSAVLLACSLTIAIAGIEGPAGAAPAVPTAPRAVSAVPFGNNLANLTWKAPASNGGSPILGYTVTPYIGVYAQTPVAFNSTLTSQTVTGLQNAVTYQFVVSARNAVGTGAPALRAGKVTVGSPFKPRAPIATWSVAPNQLQVIFYAPKNGGAPITSYTAGCISRNGGKPGSATGPPKALKGGFVIYVNKLTAAKRYNCQVKATNSRGSSPLSGGGPFRVVASVD